MISTRLKLIRTNLGLSQKKFGDLLGIAQTSYANYEGGKTFLPANILEILNKQTDVNLNWLITGIGDMYLNSDGTEKDGSYIYKVDNKASEREDTVYIPMTDLSLSAGSGIDWKTGIYTGEEMPVPAKITRRYSSYVLAGAEVKGNSMEPTLHDGEPVVFAKDAIEGDGLYVIAIYDELFVKRVSIDRLDKTITIISDNQIYPTKTYPIDKEGLMILGKVVFWLHME